MNQNEERIPAGGVVAEAIAYAKKAKELRDAAISELLAQREKIERDLATLGYETNSLNGARAPKNAPDKSQRRFRNTTLAQAVKVLLTEYPSLHGKEIEKLLKTGGLGSSTRNFQNYLPVALKRAGGFENVGGNTWKLNEAIQPER